MKTVFLFLLIFCNACFGQKYPNPIEHVSRYYQKEFLPAKQISFSQTVFEKLVEKRAYLQKAENLRSDKNFEFHKAYWLVILQSEVADFTVREDLYDTLEVSNYVTYVKALDTFSKSIPADGKELQKQKVYEMNSTIGLLHKRYVESGSLAKFLSNSNFKEWYEVNLICSEVAEIQNKIENEGALPINTKINMLSKADSLQKTVCTSIFSSCSCETPDYLTEKVLQEKAEFDRKKLLAERQQEEHDRVMKVLAAADELRRNGKLEESLELYKSVENYYGDENYVKDSIYSIIRQLDIKRFGEEYLYNSKGELVYDSRLSIEQDVLKKLKGNMYAFANGIFNGMTFFLRSDCLERSAKTEPEQPRFVPINERITDTVKILYRIVYDSTGLLEINHMLLTDNAEDGKFADSLIRHGIRYTFQHFFESIKLPDSEQHELFLPVIYIPGLTLPSRCQSFFAKADLWSNEKEYKWFSIKEYYSISIERPDMSPRVPIPIKPSPKKKRGVFRNKNSKYN